MGFLAIVADLLTTTFVVASYLSSGRMRARCDSRSDVASFTVGSGVRARCARGIGNGSAALAFAISNAGCPFTVSRNAERVCGMSSLPINASVDGIMIDVVSSNVNVFVITRSGSSL